MVFGEALPRCIECPFSFSHLLKERCRYYPFQNIFRVALEFMLSSFLYWLLGKETSFDSMVSGEGSYLVSPVAEVSRAAYIGL